MEDHHKWSGIILVNAPKCQAGEGADIVHFIKRGKAFARQFGAKRCGVLRRHHALMEGGDAAFFTCGSWRVRLSPAGNQNRFPVIVASLAIFTESDVTITASARPESPDRGLAHPA